MASALIGQPPNTDEDYYIARGIILKLGLDLDPAKGVAIPPLRPPGAHFETRGPSIAAAHAMCVVVIVLVTGTRLLIRALHHRVKWGWDDWLMIPAALAIIVWFVLGIAIVTVGGGGKHIWSITYHEFNKFQRLDLVKSYLYFPAACLVQFSITLYNRRITGLASRTWLRINDLFLCILSIYLVSHIVWVCSRCPINSYSYYKIGHLTTFSKCSSVASVRFILGLAIMHVILSFCLLCTPIIVLWRIKMDRAKKIRPCIIFIVGSVSCVSALMIQVVYPGKVVDAPYNYLRLEKWVILDLFFGVTVASFPVLQGQLPKSWSLFKSYTRSYSHSRSHGTGTHPVSTSASNRRKTEIYRHDGLESKSNNFRSDVDDEIELLQQRQRKAPGNVDQPPKVLIKVDDFDSKSFKQQSRDESPESGVTGSH